MTQVKSAVPPDGEPVLGDMSSAEFRQWGRAAVDWIAAYMDGVEAHPVLAQVHPGDLLSALPAVAPEEREAFAEIFEDFQRLIVPGLTHWNHPSFFGYFAITGSGPGTVAELLSAALNVNAMVWRTSPAGTELEQRVVAWLRDLVGLPEPFEGVIQDTASTSTLTALTAARHRAYPLIRDRGWGALPRGRVYASAEAHSSVDKAAIVLGFGREGLCRIPVDDRFRMLPAALRDALRSDVEKGVKPVAIVATLGTTSTSSVDPVRELADLAAEFEAWLHVDAAYAGTAAILPEMRDLFDGWERADSLVFNPHKWLFTPLDCSILLTRSPAELRESTALTPEYLSTPEDEDVTNLMDYGIALGRRFRALKLWFVLRYFGARGLRGRLREHVRMARTFAEWVEGEEGWEVLAPVPFSTVAFRYVGAEVSEADRDARNLAIMTRVNATGRAFLSHTRLGRHVALRLSIGNLRTTEAHVREAWELLKTAALTVQGESD